MHADSKNAKDNDQRSQSSKLEAKSSIHLATDHAGIELKEYIEQWLLDNSYSIVDHGAFAMDPDDDYPDFIMAAARAVSESEGGRAIIFGGSGQGEAIAANRYPGVRAALWYGGPEEIITLSREHNDANVLSLGARFLTQHEAQRAVELWLNTEFSSDERHVRRIAKIDNS